MDWLSEVMQDVLLHRLLFSFLLGTLIGLERQLRHKMSGIITNALVSVGTTLFMIFGHQFSADTSARMAAQIISGIGFLGGGVIIRDGFSVRGINTAATLWCSAAIGLLCSHGHVRYALIGTGMILIANVGLKPIAIWLENSKLGNQDVSFEYEITVECAAPNEQDIVERIRKILAFQKGLIRGAESRMIEDSNYVRLRINMSLYGQNDEMLADMLTGIKQDYDVPFYHYEKERL